MDGEHAPRPATPLAAVRRDAPIPHRAEATADAAHHAAAVRAARSRFQLQVRLAAQVAADAKSRAHGGVSPRHLRDRCWSLLAPTSSYNLGSDFGPDRGPRGPRAQARPEVPGFSRRRAFNTKSFRFEPVSARGSPAIGSMSVVGQSMNSRGSDPPRDARSHARRWRGRRASGEDAAMQSLRRSPARSVENSVRAWQPGRPCSPRDTLQRGHHRGPRAAGGLQLRRISPRRK
jgi:hypothetical protein